MLGVSLTKARDGLGGYGYNRYGYGYGYGYGKGKLDSKRTEILMIPQGADT